MKKVVTFGVFDLFHFGHLKLFQNIKKMFGHDCYLIVCLQDSNSVLTYKPDAKVLHSTEERYEMLKELRIVDEVVIFDGVDNTISKIDFDIWAKGPDQNSTGVQLAVEWCKNNNKPIVEIPRTEGISSTYIKKIINDL